MEKGPYVKGIGPLTCKLMIIGEAPGASEEEFGLPFVGATGQLLDDLLRDAGINRDECYITNVVKYRPPMNDFKRLDEIGINLKDEINNLWKEIRNVKPNCILALGDKALSATTGKSGIHNYRGSILSSKDGTPKVVSSFHPANLLYQRARKGSTGLFRHAWKYVMIADFKRALEESYSPLLKLPDRVLNISRSSLDLYRFLKRYEHLDKATIDIESSNCIPVCIGIAFNKHEAISIPLYSRFGGCKFSDQTPQDLAETWRLLAKFLKSIRPIGQNFKYDEEKLYRLGLYCGNLFADTLSLEHTLNPELPSKKLHVISSIRTREPFYKDEGSEFNPLKDSVDRLLLYNAKDCVVTYECWEDQDAELSEWEESSPNIRSFYYDFVVPLHGFYLELERTGYKVDKHVRHRLDQKYTAWHNKIQRWFKENLKQEVNVNSPKQLFKLIYGDLRCPTRKDTGEDTLVQLLTNVIKDDFRKSVLNNIIDDRRVRKSNSTYVHAKLDYDERIRTSYYITGTETGRSTTSVLKPPIRPTQSGLAFQTITAHGEIGSDIKRMFIPDEGYSFLSVDLSQAEARVVAVLCEDWELLTAFDTIDIHRRTAGLVFDYTNSVELTKLCSNPDVDLIGKDSGERFVGKKTRHAGNLGMGPEEYHKQITTDARRFKILLDFSEYKAKKSLQKFHGASPKVQGVFHRDIRNEINRTRILVNPFGRVRTFLDRMSEKLYKEGNAQIPQSTVHDYLLSGGLRIKKQLPNLKFIEEKHDSFTLLVESGRELETAKIIKEKIECPINFRNGSIKRDIDLILPCDFSWSDKNLKDMKKLKI